MSQRKMYPVPKNWNSESIDWSILNKSFENLIDHIGKAHERNTIREKIRRGKKTDESRR